MSRLCVRLSIGFLAVTWTALGVVALVVRASVAHSFDSYVIQRDASQLGETLIVQLQDYYAQNNSWVGVETVLESSGRGRGLMRGQGGVQTFVADQNGVIIAASEISWMGQHIHDVGPNRSVSLSVNRLIVGYLGEQTPGAAVLAQAETQFRDEMTHRLLWAAAITGLIAPGVGFGLSWGLTRPLQRLTHRVNTFTVGKTEPPIVVGGTAEIRELAQAFNQLWSRLDETEQARQKMSSDVAHELRTPVSILRGHLEAMMDGVYPLDNERLVVAYDQTLHLARLVEDMRLLTRAEAGQLPLDLQTVSPGALVEPAIARFAPLALDGGITLRHSIASNLPSIVVDNNRMQQIFDNLLTNALRHTLAGGVITLCADAQPQGVRFCVSNTGQLDPEQAAHLFDRFWRADEARQRDAGGSGLGLAITRQLVLLHQGRIWVESGDNETRFLIELPAAASADG